jgi:hypothetical protein
MLLHGLQGVHGKLIDLPRQQADYPASEYLEIRY